LHATIRGDSQTGGEDWTGANCDAENKPCELVRVKTPGRGTLTARLQWTDSDNRLGVFISTGMFDGRGAYGLSPLEASLAVAAGETLLVVSFEASGGHRPPLHAAQPFDLTTSFRAEDVGAPARSDPASLIGKWQGSTTVDAIRGAPPECLAPFWRVGFADALAARIQFPPSAIRSTALDLDLRQQASEECHLQLAAAIGSISAESWPYDEFDCALVPELCPLRCHFRLQSSEWACPGPAPEVWILGIRLTATFTDALRRELRGTIEIPYDTRPAGGRGTYQGMAVVKRFDLIRVPE
jgi:hypothetical protein